MKTNWTLVGGYGYKEKTHAYVYKYAGKKPWPEKKKWRMVYKDGKTRKTEIRYFFRWADAVEVAAYRF